MRTWPDAVATSTPFAVSGYVLVALLITLVALWFAPETSRVDLHAEQPDTADTARR